MPRHRVPALLILAIAFLVADADPSLSRNPYKNAFFSVYPAADGTALTDVPSNANHCGVCHFDFDGSGTRNPYGLDVQVGLNSGQYASTADVILAIQDLDSDNDGFSNLVEITDTVNFPNTPTFPGLTAGNVANTVNVNQADLVDFLTPTGGSDTDPPAVTVLTPDGGEIAAATGTVLVTWTADDPSGVTRVDLYLSGDDGGDWEPMARNLPNDGSYLMFVPNYPGDLARIKVSARDGAGNWGEDASNGPFSITPLTTGTAPTTLRDFKMPGTQPLTSGVLEDPGANCVTCHGDYNHAVEPWHNWRGSMMANAMRDPLMLALLAIAEQDAPASGDLCLRCHSPGGWQEGHSFDTSGGMMTAKDRQSVQCDYCHRLVDHSYVPGVSPAADEAILAAIDPLPPAYANGMFVTDPDPIRRGPYADAQADHQFLHSPFHLEAGLCGICHDVSNPAF
ncbi:MAG: hypothetical protein JW819_13335, partial [Candidatus Krumholzibacteriota bacterium]|nr:hypothetical protein [Candidatus Krumholzibacteriota bacterium]